MDPKFFLKSFLTKLFQGDNDEKWATKIQEHIEGFKFEKINQLSSAIKICQFNYEGGIYFLLFDKNLFIGFSEIEIQPNQLIIHITKIVNKFQRGGYGTILSNFIIQIAKQNTNIKKIISYPDGVEGGKQFRLKQGFENKGQVLELKLRD